MKRTIVCEQCTTIFGASSRRARFCGDACRARARRSRVQQALPPDHAPPQPLTSGELLAEIDALLELLPEDVALLEARFPESASDPEIDELICSLSDTIPRFLEQLRTWITSEAAA